MAILVFLARLVVVTVVHDMMMADTAIPVRLLLRFIVTRWVVVFLRFLVWNR